MEDKSIIFAFHEAKVRYFVVTESIIRISETTECILDLAVSIYERNRTPT